MERSHSALRFPAGSYASGPSVSLLPAPGTIHLCCTTARASPLTERATSRSRTPATDACFGSRPTGGSRTRRRWSTLRIVCEPVARADPSTAALRGGHLEPSHPEARPGVQAFAEWPVPHGQRADEQALPRHQPGGLGVRERPGTRSARSTAPRRSRGYARLPVTGRAPYPWPRRGPGSVATLVADGGDRVAFRTNALPVEDPLSSALSAGGRRRGETPEEQRPEQHEHGPATHCSTRGRGPRCASRGRRGGRRRLRGRGRLRGQPPGVGVGCALALVTRRSKP